MGQSLKCVDCGTVNWQSVGTCARCGSDELIERLPEGAVLFKNYCEPGRTFSRNVARFFEVVDYLLLVPGALAVLFSLILIAEAPWVPLLAAGWMAIGCLLLGGYRKHSRNQPLERGTTFLWSATISYNLVQVVAVGYFGEWHQEVVTYAIWPLVAIAFSIAALRSEEKAKQKAFARKYIIRQTAA